MLIVDDLIATGGTTQAMHLPGGEHWAARLQACWFLMELAGLKGREASLQDIRRGFRDPSMKANNSDVSNKELQS